MVTRSPSWTQAQPATYSGTRFILLISRSSLASVPWSVLYSHLVYYKAIPFPIVISFLLFPLCLLPIFFMFLSCLWFFLYLWLFMLAVPPFLQFSLGFLVVSQFLLMSPFSFCTVCHHFSSLLLSICFLLPGRLFLYHLLSLILQNLIYSISVEKNLFYFSSSLLSFPLAHTHTLTLTELAEPVLRCLAWVVVWVGACGGASAQVAVLADLLDLATLHLYCFYVYAARYVPLGTYVVQYSILILLFCTLLSFFTSNMYSW